MKGSKASKGVAGKEEELKEKDLKTGPVVEPEDLGDQGAPADAAAKPFERPAAGEMAPYQRPVDPQGFDPNAGAAVGTGGLY